MNSWIDSGVLQLNDYCLYDEPGTTLAAVVLK